MTEFFSVCGILVIGSATLTIFGGREKQLSSLISSLIYIISFVYVIGKAASLWDKTASFFHNFNGAVPIEYIMQISGIAILGSVSASVCEQVGQKGIAGAIEILAIIETLHISLPWCSELFEKLFLIFGE